jgi:UDP-N-acetylmuramoyl-tripeptide--D-alanyl-D-alanine ligase
MLFYIGGKFRFVKKVKHTKRVVRFLACFFILFGLSCYLVIRFISIYCISGLFSFVYLLVFLLSSFTWLILYPIEKFIGLHYINKCSKKLLKMSNLKKIGITGSFGKTSTKEILHAILSEEFNVLSTPKSYNTPFGITKTINNLLDSSHEIFVAEMGAKNKGEIRELCQLVKVDYGIVTSVGRQHTNTFGGIDGVYLTKKELPDYLVGKSCVFNLMNCYVNKMYRGYVGKKIGVFLIVKHNFKLSCGCIKNNKHIKPVVAHKYGKLCEFSFINNFYAKNISLFDNGACFEVWFNRDKLLDVAIDLIGIHNVINVLLAIAMAYMMGESVDNIRLGLRKVKPINARLQKTVLKSGAIVINNGYNSNIDSAKFAFMTLSLFKGKNRIVITPGLIETEDDYEYNRMFGLMLSKYCDEVVVVKYKNRDAICAGLKEGGFNFDRINFVETFEDARAYINNASGNDVLLIENDLPDNYK